MELMEGMCGTQEGDRALWRARGGFSGAVLTLRASEGLETFPPYHKSCERERERRRRLTVLLLAGQSEVGR